MFSMRFVINLLASALLVSCAARQTPNADCLTVSIAPEAYFVERLAGNAFEINVMVPRSVGHSNYSPLPSQMVALSRSAAYLAVGQLDFELTWRSRLTDANPSMRWVDLNAGVDMIEGSCRHEHHHESGHHSVDPHYWMSPRGAAQMARNIASAIVGIRPSLAHSVDSALAVLTAQIDSVDAEFQKLAPDSLVFVVYHPALAYLARDYAMTQLVLESDGNAPTPQGMCAMIDRAGRSDVRTVFIQKSFDVNLVSVVSETIGACVVEINPEGADWFAEMRRIYDGLKDD